MVMKYCANGKFKKDIYMNKFVLFFLIFASQSFAFEGKEYFKQNCSVCHSIGGGDKIGPDLAEVSKRRKLDWIVKFINYPEGMIFGDEEEKGYEKPDPLAKKIYELYKPSLMPEHELEKEEVEDVLKYIDSLKKKPKGRITTIK